MKKITFLFFILFVFGLGFISCKKDKSFAPDMGYNYFPDQVGKYVVYDVDSFYCDDSKTDTFKFQIKEKIQAVFLDNENRPTLRLERYIKKYRADSAYYDMKWTLRNVCLENKTITNAEKVEENSRFVKLVFPIKISQTWNGNAQNIKAGWEYGYDFFDQPRWVGALHFDSVLQVNQYDDKNKILTERKLYIEKYARNVGMIYKQVIDVKSQCPSSDPAVASVYYSEHDILKRITSGIRYTYTINSYGIEL
jgi:hypothetical protein